MNWLQKTCSEGFLSSLGVPPDIINFVMSIPAAQRQRYINTLHKNPKTTLEQLRQISQPKSPYTEREMWFTRRYDNPFKTWALIQYKKHRVNKSNKYVIEYDYNPHINTLEDQIFQIHDWWRVHAATTDINSYTFEQAKLESDKWHEIAASKGEGLNYEEINSQSIVYGPQWQNQQQQGWTVQQVTSQNDLFVEGNRMHHCVGDEDKGYYQDIQNNKTFIYSLRDPSNHPHVTIEIAPNNEIVQIRGYGNSDPKPQYKQMLKEWFSEFKKSKPNLRMQNSDELSWRELSYVDNRKIDNKIIDMVNEPDEYGFTPDISQIDIMELYNTVMNEFTNRGNNDGYYYFMKDAAETIVDIAWRIDKQKIKDYDSTNFFDMSNPSDVKSFKSRESQVYQLEQIIDKNMNSFDNQFYAYSDPPTEDDYLTTEEYNNAFKEWEEQESDEQESYLSHHLPWAFDRVMMDEIYGLKQTDPILPEDKAKYQPQKVAWSMSYANHPILA